MDGPLLYSMLFVLGLAASWAGGFISGGTSLISVAGMLLLGLPAHIAMPTYFAGALAAHLSYFREYKRAKQIIWKHVAPLSVAAFFGSMIGAFLLAHTNEEAVQNVFSAALLVFIPIAFIKMHLGTTTTPVTRQRVYLGYIAYFLISAWAGFFAAWAGVLMLYAFLYFFGMTILQVKGTESVPGAFMDIGALIIFIYAGTFNVAFAAAFVPGIIVGAIFGARTALWMGNHRLQLFVKASIVVISAKVIFQLKILRPILSLFGIVT